MRIYRKGDLEIFKDERGYIADMLPKDVVVKSVMYITGHKGAVRGNHWHKKDTHYCFVVRGRIRYVHQGLTMNPYQVLEPGDMVYSPVGEKHRFEFIDDGIFIAMATEPRTHENYEEDTTREDF